ncbi:phage tail protein [Acinetobacter nosocomialis]|uniref:TipJ family phage tail tip protein n=1 Tax=Acinetobacter nosocomialis TaxID=106654 RepID=UPI000B3DC1B2|nr:phage tail protein [Acinetobacter nosocomialis]MBD0444071.1 phage tail protein [Acinetobacter nosocomialis]MDQ9040006.1 phage tail protein [Acinetobacter nosocomialis]MDR9530975.1 phage tail protein [Acinetobacter nosocomialis]OUT25594.1 phage-related protein, tail component [Acinetobacter nosocomialis P020]PSE16179.1 phage tail protein [Acinetobacter nosocomialis]
MSIVKGSKKASGQARQPNIAPDSAQSKTRINILYGLAEGEIEGLASGNKSILLENTPLEDNNGKLNFENVKVDFRSGTNDQDYIEGFPAVENETAVDVELKADTPWVKSFKNLDLDALRIRFKWGPLRSQDAKSGDVSGVTIEYAVDVQTDGGPWTEVLKTKISDKTSANYERAHRINLPKADSDWLVRVRRLTPNSTSEYISDKMYIEAVTEVIDAKLRYPNTALLGLQYDAETFNNVAKIAVECKGTKIKLPSNYNPVSRKYTGMWDGTFISAYSNNPAWIYYDICTSDRYGLGDRLTPFMIDKWSLYRLGQYCDESVNDGQGGQEPRFTCNVYLQRAEEAYEILKKLAGVFRAISYWDGNSIICDADIPQDTYFTYTRANVIGEFEYSGTRARDRHNVVKVAFDNPANHYKTEYEYVRDEQAISDSGQIRVLDLNAWGCTSRGQAQRAGLWALKSEQSETRTVTFKVGLDGWIPQPGRVIEIADELFAGRANGGRVSAISEDRFNLTIDRDDVVAKPGDRLVVNGENGKAQTRVIQSINGRVITVTLPFDLGSIAAENIWVIDAQDLATMKFRVISIRQEEKNKFTINAIQYNPQKFDEIDNGAHFEEVPISIINPTIQDPVSDISITSENKVNQGINITTMILSWKQAKGAVKYLVEWRKDNSSWIRLPLTGNNSIEVQGVYSGNYQARVTAISAFEVSSLPIYSSITELVGKKGLPPKLEYIRATGILFGMQLDWSFPNAGAQDAAYVEIRVSPDGANNIAPLGQFAYPTNTHKVQGLQPNLIQYYSGRIVDKIGNVGPWSEWINGTTSGDPDAVLDLISGQIAESDLAKELQGKIEDTANVAAAAGQAAVNAQAAATAANNAADQASVKAGSAVNLANQVAGLANNAATMAVNAQNLASKTAGDLKNATDQLNKSIADEANARVTAVSQLNDGLTTETAQRKSEDASLLNSIETYKASTNGTLSSLQEQVTTNATNTGANASKITSLDSRLTTNEGKTGEAINAAATAQQTANTAVDQASVAANSVTALRTDLSGGKGKNAIIAPYSDPQVLAFDVVTSAATCALAISTMRVKGKAYDITFTSANGAVYFGTTSTAYAVNRAAATVRGGKKYLLSMYAKSQDVSKVVDFYVTVRWFRRLADNSILTTDVSLSSQVSGTTRITPTTAGQVITCKSVTAPSDAFAMSFWVTGNNLYNVAGSRLMLDMLMLEESIGDDKSASMWVAGAPDLGAIQSSLDANASAITNLTTRVANDEGTITSHSQSITQLNNSITSINGSLSTKADVSALNSLDTKVTNIDGRVTSNANAVTSLQGQVNTVEKGLSTKVEATALNNYYTKTEADNATSGAINSFNSSLVIGGRNLVRNTQTVREGLEWLFVEPLVEPLIGQFTISFDIENLDGTLTGSGVGFKNSNGDYKYFWLPDSSTGHKSVTMNIDSTGFQNFGLYFNSKVRLKNVKVEKGSKETGWSPAPEDVKASIDLNASAIQTTQTNVSNIDGRLNAATDSITSLNSRMSTAEGGIAGANSAINTLSTRISDAEGKLTSQSNSVTQLSDQIGNTKSYSIVTFRNGSAIGLPKDGGIHSYKGKINGFGRGLNLIVFNNGDVSSVQAFDTYGDMATACTNLNNAIQALASGTYFAIVGTDNIASVSIHGAAETLRATLLACGASRSYLNTWVGNSLPIFIGRTNLDAGNGILAMFDSSINNQWIEYPLTFVNGAPVGMGDSRAITTQLDANASAISSLSNKVTQQGNDITSQSNAITSLNNSLSVSGKAGANLLIKSNVVGTYDGVGYPHVAYEMGEDWEVGAKYTLLWCAEHKRGAGDANSALWAYAGGGMQGVQGIENTNGRVINKITFTKDGVATGKFIHFYMINHPTADKNSVGTVYWAVLVKGDLITTDAWVPSAYDYLPDAKANSTALNSLDSKVTNIDGRVTSNNNAITSLNSRIATAEGNIASNANAVANTYTKAQADEAAAGQINSFNSSLVIGGRNLVRNTGGVREGAYWLFIESLVEPLMGTYTVSFDIENLDGNITGSGVGFRNPNGDYHYFWYPDSATGHKSVTMNLDSTGFVHFGIWFNNQTRLKNVKVEKGVKDTGWSPAPEDVKAGIDANASAISSLDAKVTQQGNSITSNSHSITSLSNTITNNDLTNWVRNANFADPRNDWSSGAIVDAVNAAPNPPSPKALALNNRDAYYGPMFRCNAGDMYYVSAWFASPVAGDAYSTLGFHYFDTAGNQGWVGVVFTTVEKRRSWTMLEGYFTVPEGMAQLHPWLQVSAWDTVPNEKWHVTNIQVRNITGNKKLVSDLQANSTALNNLSSRVSTTEGNIASQSSSITSLTNQIGNTKSYSIVTFRNGSAASSMPKPSGIHSFQGRVGTFGRGLNLIVFNNNGDVVSCTAYDTYGDIVGNCNALYYAVNALASGTYFAIVGNDNIRDVGVLNPDTPLRELMLSCGASDKYFKSWNWTSLPIFIGRKDVGAGNGILGMFDSELPNQWIEYPLVFVGGAPQGMGDSRAVTAQLDANAAAISSLSNTVTQQGNDIISHSNALTSLSASVSGIYKEIQLSDTRNDNQPPAWYWQNHGLKIVREFKLASVLGLSGLMSDLYVTLETQVPWTDPSGGPIIQIARGASSTFTAERRSADYNSWYPWSQDIKALSDGLVNKADASAITNLDAKITTVDGKVSTQAQSITDLNTSVGNNSASIRSQQQSIDGLISRATLKLQSGNLVGGVGIENDSKTVDFIIQANKFAIGAPSNVDAGSVTPKYAFVYQSTATTLPNGTVIPAGLYLDNASIGYINADKINAASLSAISANLGTLTTLKDSAKPNGARMVLTGSLITVYDDNNTVRVRLGLW